MKIYLCLSIYQKTKRQLGLNFPPSFCIRMTFHYWHFCLAGNKENLIGSQKGKYKYSAKQLFAVFHNQPIWLKVVCSLQAVSNHPLSRGVSFGKKESMRFYSAKKNRFGR